MTYRIKKWQKLSTITLLMAGVITLNGGEFRSVDKHQIAVADTNVQTPDYEKLRNTCWTLTMVMISMMRIIQI